VYSFEYEHNLELEEVSGNAPGRKEVKGNNYEHHLTIQRHTLLDSRDYSSVVIPLKKSGLNGTQKVSPLLSKMPWPFKDYDFYGNRYVNIEEIMWYDRENIHDGKRPTECLICIEAETEMYTKYAHPKAHLEAHTHSGINAENLAIKEKNTEEYLEYYTFYYQREYIKIYKELYKKYKEEYSMIVLSRSYDSDAKICDYHIESIQYHCEQKK
jgi:hypothetical protein